MRDVSGWSGPLLAWPWQRAEFLVMVTPKWRPRPWGPSSQEPRPPPFLPHHGPCTEPLWQAGGLEVAVRAPPISLRSLSTGVPVPRPAGRAIEFEVSAGGRTTALRRYATNRAELRRTPANVQVYVPCLAGRGVKAALRVESYRSRCCKWAGE